ncbi:MAG: hypothetical protein AAF609_17365 [Cyanobacteria bacterium P01_C01_bin.120]
MSQQRLSDLAANLDLLYEKLGNFEQALIISASPEQKFALQQQIKREILPSIRRYESEYWELYPEEAIVMPEEEAEQTVSEIERAVTVIERVDPVEYPPGMLDLLLDIRQKLDDLDSAAAAKLKVAIPIVPMLASYELEMDTENTLSQLWRSVRKRLKR